MNNIRYNLFMVAFAFVGASVWMSTATVKQPATFWTVMLYLVGWFACVVVGALFGAIAAAFFGLAGLPVVKSPLRRMSARK